MEYFYLFCLVPITIGAVIYYFNREINILEWGAGSLISFLIAGVFHHISYISQIKDEEVWSGKIVMVKQFSEWKEQYLEDVYVTKTYTDSQGNTRTITRFSHTETKTRWHDKKFVIYTDIQSSFNITEQKYNYLVSLFGNKKAVRGKRRTSEKGSKMIAGDPYDYESYCGEVIEPIHESRYFVNKIRSSRSVFNFAPIPKDFERKLHEYPYVYDIFKSERVKGTAKQSISVKEWDKMCARLGTRKNVNLIIIGFDSPNSMLGEWQRSKWLGGKKNDIVLCYGHSWSFVFGWSDADIMKKNLETILIKNKKDNSILPLIEAEIEKNYIKTKWSKFDHLRVEPKTSHWVWFIIIMIIVQSGLYVFFHMNETDRDF